MLLQLSLGWFVVICLFSVGAFLFSGLCVIGSSTFAAGIFLKGTSAMLPVMLLGRLLFGSGNGSLTSKDPATSVHCYQSCRSAICILFCMHHIRNEHCCWEKWWKPITVIMELHFLANSSDPFQISGLQDYSFEKFHMMTFNTGTPKLREIPIQCKVLYPIP